MKNLLFTAIIASVTLTTSVATIYVDTNGTGDYPNIQAAIDGLAGHTMHSHYLLYHFCKGART